MTNPTILVTGAAGKTGAAVIAQLIDKGFPLRALVRRADERSAHLAALGAEVVVGDLLDIESLRSALEGAKRAYFVYPPADRLLEATTKAQSRALEVTRQWFGELTEAQKEAQDVLQRMVAANRSAGEAVVDLSRGIFSRTSEAIRATGQSVTAAATGNDGRTASREPAVVSETQAKEKEASS